MKEPATTVLYIPGLGDGYDGFRRFALKFWRRKNTKVQLVPMRWSDGSETFDQKLGRLGKIIEQASGKVVLVGESAGGSMALNAFDSYQSKIAKVITLCGKNHGTSRVNPRVFAANPAFRDSMQRVDQVVAELSHDQKQQIEIFYSPYDPTVKPADTLIDGVRSHKLPGAGHLLIIMLGLTFLRRRLLVTV